MSSSSTSDVTRLLLAWSDGDQEALASLMPLVYEELRHLAVHYLKGERASHTLQPTALIHEAYLQLIDQKRVIWRNRVQFYGVAALVMRRILLKHARHHRAAKRNHGEGPLVALDDSLGLARAQAEDVIALDDALRRLEAVDPRQGRVVELRFFGGLSIEESAEALGVSTATVKREWRMARAWLRRQLGAGDDA